jgi:predicted dehydrogenase
MSEKSDRRSFIKTATAGAVAAGLTLRGASASARIPGANDRIVAGFIGTGRMGESNLRDFIKQSNVDVAAVCDVYAPNLEKAAALAPRAAKLTDFRRLLDRKEIDVVVIATPDHWHALTMLMACQAGKDVYVEKPISLTIAEGRNMVEAARKHNRVVQVGTQQRSAIHFQKAVEIVRSGRIGKVSFVRTWNFGNQHPNGIGSPPDSDPPKDLDWDLWLGPAPKVPFNSNRFGVFPDRWSSFRWFWDYAGGMVTDWSVHLIDIVQWAMGVDYPQTISATGGKFYLQDNRETPDTIMVTYEYPGFVCTYENRECNGNTINGKGYGITFYGTDGTLFVDRGGFELFPEKRRESQNRMVDRAEPIKVENSNDQHETHVRNFLDSVRSRTKPICDIEIGHRTTSAALLANIAYRSRRRIIWDGKTEEIMGDREAARLLAKPYRKPWTLKV